MKQDAIVVAIDVSVAFNTSTFKSTNVSRIVSSIPSKRCVTVCAVVSVWSRMVVRVDAIAVELEPTSEHTSTQRAMLGSWVSSQSNKISILSIRSLCFTSWASRI